MKVVPIAKEFESEIKLYVQECAKMGLESPKLVRKVVRFHQASMGLA